MAQEQPQQDLAWRNHEYWAMSDLKGLAEDLETLSRTADDIFEDPNDNRDALKALGKLVRRADKRYSSLRLHGVPIPPETEYPGQGQPAVLVQEVQTALQRMQSLP